MEPPPSVSIVIATSARPADLRETLRSLFAVRLPPDWQVDLTIVENATQNGVKSLLSEFPSNRFAAVNYLYEPERGKSRALNLAISQTTGDIVLFTDDDIRFPADWIQRICEPIVSGRADAVAGGVKLAPSLLRPWMNRMHRAWLASTADYLEPENPSEMCGANMAVARVVLERVGGFDPELGPGITGGGEESLLTWQLKAAGFRLASALEVQVEHHFDPERLRYKNWVKAAQGKGIARAYLIHHWSHEKIRCPRLGHLWLKMKLLLRFRLSTRRNPDDEGISGWERSYIEDMAAYSRYMQERRRPRNYSLRGIRKLNS